MMQAEIGAQSPVIRDLYDGFNNSNSADNDVKFDINYNAGLSQTSDLEEVTNPDIILKQKSVRQWELDVRGMISTEKWLQNYGLKRNRLDINSILPLIGFKHSVDYDFAIKKPVTSRYGKGLFQNFLRADGKTFNVTCKKEKLQQIQHRLSQSVTLYKRRLEWLTAESRRIFGVIQEHCICIVLDINNLSPQQFDQYRCAVERILLEQVSQLAKFNIIRAAEDMEIYQPVATPVTQDSVQAAIEWLWSLDRLASLSKTATCEALVHAITDSTIESVYLFTEGSSSEGSRELLRHKLVGCSIPVHVVSYNCCDSTTMHYLKYLAASTGGRFHAYAVMMEMDSYEPLPVDPRMNRANIILKKKSYGGVPAGAGVRHDVIQLFNELEEAHNNLAQIQALIMEIPDPSSAYEPCQRENQDESKQHCEAYVGSKEWLVRNGLKAKKLGFFDILGAVAFKHCDGIVNIKEKRLEERKTEANSHQKLINAKYCDKFAHVRWKDGHIVHVQVTPEVQRNYEQRIKVVLNAVQQRIDWLVKGSRELFGTVIEEQVYFLIDTSESMIPSIRFVKDKLYQLFQDQLRHKQKFNIIGFSSRANPWRDRLIDVTERNLKNAWMWVQGLECHGSTNTMAALRFALADHHTQAVYLLTDGRPDQPTQSVLAQVQLQRSVPIHTISFNCADVEANKFLCQLAKDTNGRYHYFSEHGQDPDSPYPWESEDVQLLKEEYNVGLSSLQKITKLRDECQSLAWKKETSFKNKCSRNHSLYGSERISAIPVLDSSELYRAERPRSAQSYRPSHSPTPRPASATGYRTTSHASHRPSQKSRNEISSRVPLTAGHTRTSLLRTLSGGGKFSGEEWLLPETKELLESQWQKLTQQERSQKGKDKRKRKKQQSSMEMSSKLWLSKHGLAAKRLTIIDALGPTMIPHKSKYVPILNKHVLAKVFDQVMPLAHVSGTSRKQIHLVNPSGVNLDAYEDNLKKAIQIFKLRLNSIVWGALPEKEQEQFDSDGPVEFQENKLALMRALDRCGWPLKECEIIHMEQEIHQAEKYLQQSQDLRHTDNVSKDPDAATTVLSSVISTTGYEDLEEATESKVNEHKDEKSASTKKVLKTIDRLHGQNVVARNENDGFYYQGHVIECTDSRHALVEFDKSEHHIIPTRFVIPNSGAIARPLLLIGDFVLVHVSKDDKKECYVPGIIQVTPTRTQDQAKFYSVILYNGTKVTAMRNFLIKISKTRYLFSVRYIREMMESSTTADCDEDKCVDSGHNSDSEKEVKSNVNDEIGKTNNSDGLNVLKNQLEKLEELQQYVLSRLKRNRIKQKRLCLATKGIAKSQQQLLQEVEVFKDIKKTDSTRAWILEQEPRQNYFQDKHDQQYVIGNIGKNTGTSCAKLEAFVPLDLGEEVLARWSDEGWYYRGTIKQYCGGESYLVVDSTGEIEKIPREDIITDSDDASVVIQPHDAVVALHPDFSFSYAPGVVIRVFSDLRIDVRFYDNKEAQLLRQEVYKLSPNKFEHDVSYIIHCENQWVGQAIVARRDTTATYQLGTVKERIGDGRQYMIEWCDTSLAIQSSKHMFGGFTKRHSLIPGERVLGIADKKRLIYLPGTIQEVHEKNFTVQFCNGHMDKEIDPVQCFWLSQEYFHHAVMFCSTTLI